MAWQEHCRGFGMVALLSISAAFFWALSDVTTRIGLRYCNALSALLITLLSSLFIAFVIALLTAPLELFVEPAVSYFLLSGVIGPCVGRLLLFIGIHRVGASLSATLAGVRPLFAAVGAVAILGERITYSILVGTLLITLGVCAVTWGDGGYPHKNWSRKDLLFPLLAGVFYGLANVIRKMGLNTVPEPTLGLTLQNATALAFFPLLTLNLAGRSKLMLNKKRAWVILGLNGFAIVI
jgi:drug/metabolite transporter (DMT)-like permease